MFSEQQQLENDCGGIPKGVVEIAAHAKELHTRNYHLCELLLHVKLLNSEMRINWSSFV